MLESVLADILARVLGQYLEGIDRDHVRFGAWSGHIELRSVALRPEALAVLFETLGVALPVSVQSGSIGLLRLVVPWKSISSSPVKIFLQDVTLTARPVRADGSDDSQLENRQHRIKRAKLDTDDAVREASWDVSQSRHQKKHSSWSSWLVSDNLKGTILDNIQIYLTNITLRFEDPFSNPKSPYVSAIYCDSIKVVSANEEWQEAFVEHVRSSVTRKLLEIKGFRVEWAPIVYTSSSSNSSLNLDNEAQPKPTKSLGDSRNSAPSGSDISGDPSAPRSLIRQVDGFMHLRLGNVDTDPKHLDFRLQDPAVDLEICFPNVFIELDDVQYSCLVQTSLYFARISSRGFCPSSPRARWKWAVDQLLPRCTDRFMQACRFTPSGLRETRERRESYIELRVKYINSRRSGVTGQEETGMELERLESEISFEEILAYRDAADVKAEQDTKELSASKDSQKQENTSGSARRTIWSILGFSKGTESNDGNESDDSQEAESGSSSDGMDHPKSSFHSPTDKPTNEGAVYHSSTLALRAAFLLKSASIRMCERGYPVLPSPRVELNLVEFQLGVMYSSTQELIIEALIGSVEAWDLLNRTKMVYSRFSASDQDTSVDSSLQKLSGFYPQNISDAIAGIRGGLNPAQELVKDGSSGDRVGDKPEESASGPNASNKHRRELDSGVTIMEQESFADHCESNSSHDTRETIDEFPVFSSDLPTEKCIVAFRYTLPSSEDGSTQQPPIFDISVATIEVVVDGPVGSFVWGLKFWQPKGLLEDPILSFLGAAAGARIAKLRLELQQALLADSVPVEINAVILAPRFVIPCFGDDELVFILNMGTIGLCTSDYSQKNKLASIEGHVGLPYSNYVLTLDDLGIYFSPDLSSAVPKDLNRSNREIRSIEAHRESDDDFDLSFVEGVEQIIRPISLHFLLQTLQDSSVSKAASTMVEENQRGEVAKFRVLGSVPQLSLVFTQKVLQHIIVMSKIWADGLASPEIKEDATLGHSSDDVKPWQEIGSDGVVPVSRQEVLDGVGALSKRIAPPRDSQEIESEGKVLSRLEFAAYDVRIEVQAVSIDLRTRSDSKLLTMRASGLRANAWKSKDCLKANMALQHWFVIDETQENINLRILLGSGSTLTCLDNPSSQMVALEKSCGNSSPDGQFIDIQYSTDFLKLEEHFSIRFSSFYMNCMREVFLRIMHLVAEVCRQSNLCYDNHFWKSDPDGGTEPEHVISLKGNQDDMLPNSDKNEDQPESIASKKLKAQLELVSFTGQLVASGSVISSFEVKQCMIDVSIAPDGLIRARGIFGAFFIRDHTTSFQEHAYVLSYQSSDGTFTCSDTIGSFSSTDSPVDEWVLTIRNNAPSHFSVTLNNVHLVVLNRFVVLLQEYFLALMIHVRPLLSSIHNEAASEPQSIMQHEPSKGPNPKSSFLISSNFHNVSICFPRNSTSKTESLRFNITQVTVCNQDDDTLLPWAAYVNGLQGTVQYVCNDLSNYDDSSVSSAFIAQSRIELRMETLSSEVDESRSNESRTDVININFQDPLHVNLSEAQYTVLFFVLTENFAERNSDDSVDVNLVDPKYSLNDSESLDQDHHRAASQSHRLSKSYSDVSNETGDSTNPECSLKLKVALSELNLEISRGWDVSQDSCKIFGLYLSEVSIEVCSSVSQMLVEFGCESLAARDLRTEARPVCSQLLRQIFPDRSDSTAQRTETKVANKNCNNVSISYEKNETKKPAITVFLKGFQVEVIPELLRDLSFLAIPGGPFLESSPASLPNNNKSPGQTLSFSLSESHIIFLSESSDVDRRALVLTGGFKIDVDWVESELRSILLKVLQTEIFTIPNAPLVDQHAREQRFFESSSSLLLKSCSSLLYPTDLLLKLDCVDDGNGTSQYAQCSMDAALCILRLSEIPLLHAIFKRFNSLRPSYLSQRKWRHPDPSSIKSGNVQNEHSEDLSTGKLKMSLSIPTSRFHVSDDTSGRFAPILEIQLVQLQISSDPNIMIQSEGQVSLNFFNFETGYWEPAIENWDLSVSMGIGQKGLKSFVLKSDKRMNINVTPNTIASTRTAFDKLMDIALENPKIGAESDRYSAAAAQSIKAVPGTNRRPSVAAYLVRNELGIDVHMSLQGGLGWETIKTLSEVEVGAETKDLASSGAGDWHGSREHVFKSVFLIHGFKEKELSACTAGKFHCTFYPTKELYSSPDKSGNDSENMEPLNVIWEVVFRKGTPLCTLRSPIRILNFTKVKLHLITLPQSSDGSTSLSPAQGDSTVTLSPNEHFSIPIYNCSRVFSICPSISSSSKSTTDPGSSSFAYHWSSPLPKMSWLFTMAHDKTNAGKITSSSREEFENVSLMECKPLNGDQSFFFKAVSEASDSITSSKNLWLDVHIRAPFVLMNKLPGPLHFRIRTHEPNMVSKSIHKASVLTAGVIPEMEEIHVHTIGKDLNSYSLSLAFDNNVRKSAGARKLPSSFGLPVSLEDLESGKAKMISTHSEGLVDSRGRVREQFHAAVSLKGVRQFSFFAGVWVRNRSDTCLDVCSRSTMQNLGSAPVYISDCDPSNPPNNYICCEGPYLSVRLNQKHRSGDKKFEKCSEWWTLPTPVGTIAKPIVINLPSRSLELEVRPAESSDFSTFIVTIRNSFWIINKSSLFLQWCHHSSLDSHGECPPNLIQSLHHGQMQGIHCEKSDNRSVHLRLATKNGESEWKWSLAIPVDIGYSRELPAKIYCPKTCVQYVARISSQVFAGNSRALVIHSEDRQNPPYRIVNRCCVRALAFCQMGTNEPPWLVRAGTTTRYSWDDPLARADRRRLSVRVLEREELENKSSTRKSRPSILNIDKVGDRIMVLAESFKPPVIFDVTVDGVTKVVTLYEEGNRPLASAIDGTNNSKPEDSIPIVEMSDLTRPEQDQCESSSETSKENITDYPTAGCVLSRSNVASETGENRVETSVFLQSIGISVIEGTPAEIIYLSMSGIFLVSKLLNQSQYVALSLEHFQIDNQLTKTSYPVLLWTSSCENESGGSHDENALAVEFQRDASKDGIFMLQNFRACIRPCSIAFENGLISSVLKFLHDSTLVRFGNRQERLQGLDEEGQAFRFLLDTDDNNATGHSSSDSLKRIYVHDFKIDATSIRFTSEGSGGEIAKAAGLSSSVRALIGLLFNIEDCNFTFPEVNLQDVFDTLDHFAVLIREYYLKELDHQRLKLLTSNPIVGNPAALLNAVGTGAHDLLVKPGKAKGSVEFLTSVGRGSKSFFAHTVGGIADTASKLPRVVSTGIENVVGDGIYVQERQRIRRSNLASGYHGSTSENPVQGLVTGAVSFMHGISSGATGIIREPMQGAKQGGAEGLIKGIGKAFVGGIAKPIVGALDLVSEPVAGLSWQMTDSSSSHCTVPARPPRSFRGTPARIERFDMHYSLGSWLLKAVVMMSGVLIHGELIDWVELSNRPGRREYGSELQVWLAAQKFSRCMPGMKKQVQMEVRRRGTCHSGIENACSEKTQVALLTRSELIVATLGCELITVVPIWEDAMYDITGDGENLVVRATIIDDHRLGKSRDSTSIILREAQSLLQAPWDAVPGRKRKPAVGESSVDRIPCGSEEAQVELRNLLLHVTAQESDKQLGDIHVEQKYHTTKGDQDHEDASLASKWIIGKKELSGQHDESNYTPEPSEDSQTGHGMGITEPLYITNENEQTFEKCISSESVGDDHATKPGVLRIKIDNRAGDGIELRLKSGRLERGAWKTDTPVQIPALKTIAIDVGYSEGKSEGYLEAKGEVEYSMVESSPKIEVQGDMVLTFIKKRHSPAMSTIMATDGFTAGVNTSEYDGVWTIEASVTRSCQSPSNKLDDKA